MFLKLPLLLVDPARGLDVVLLVPVPDTHNLILDGPDIRYLFISRYPIYRMSKAGLSCRPRPDIWFIPNWYEYPAKYRISGWIPLCLTE